MMWVVNCNDREWQLLGKVQFLLQATFQGFCFVCCLSREGVDSKLLGVGALGDHQVLPPSSPSEKQERLLKKQVWERIHASCWTPRR